MSKNLRPCFLFFGYGSEYVLQPLYHYMVKAGDCCVEIDMLTHPDVITVLKSLVEKPIVFITSAHFLCDQRNFSVHYHTQKKLVSVLQVISTLRPIISVYYPHDLSVPIKAEEHAYLPLFDLLLAPFKDLDYLNAYLPVVEVGWIKYTPQVDDAFPKSVTSSKKIFFISAYQYYLNRGLDVFYKEYRPLFEAGVSIKLPYFNQNAFFEGFLREKGVHVYSSQANSVQIIEENEVILAQNLSSIVTEAVLLGKKVVYLRKALFDHEPPEKFFAHLGDITYIHSPQEFCTLHYESLSSTPKAIQAFDFIKARQLLWNFYEERIRI